MQNDYILTFDVDWAPDFMIDNVSNQLIEQKLHATWFLTHDSPSVQRLFEYRDLFDFGIHPNFFPNSTQGKNEKEIMDNFSKQFPDIKIIRTHALFQSTYFLRRLIEKYKIKIDVSLFLSKTPNLQPHKIFLNDSFGQIIRVPFFWEDDIEMYDPTKKWTLEDSRFTSPGLKIFDFHPIHIFLNSDSMKSYEELKSRNSLKALTENDVAAYINTNSKGVDDFFHEVCDYIKTSQKKSYTISEIVAKWEKSSKN